MDSSEFLRSRHQVISIQSLDVWVISPWPLLWTLASDSPKPFHLLLPFLSGIHLAVAFDCYWASASTSPIPYKSSVDRLNAVCFLADCWVLTNHLLHQTSVRSVCFFYLGHIKLFLASGHMHFAFPLPGKLFSWCFSLLLSYIWDFGLCTPFSENPFLITLWKIYVLKLLSVLMLCL